MHIREIANKNQITSSVNVIIHFDIFTSICVLMHLVITQKTKIGPDFITILLYYYFSFAKQCFSNQACSYLFLELMTICRVI